MNKRYKWSTYCLIVALACSLIGLVYYYNLSRELLARIESETPQLAKVSGKKDALRIGTQPQKDADVTSKGVVADGKSSNRRSVKDALNALPVDSVLPKGKTDLTEVANLLETDPKFEAALLTEIMGESDKYYSDFFKSAQLSPEQAEQLRLLLADKQIEMFKDFSKARETGAGNAMKAYLDARETVNKEISRVLGPEKFAALEKYESTLGLRNNLKQYQDRLESAGAPLTTEQLDRATNALAALTPQKDLQRGFNHTQPGKTETITLANLDAVSTVFTPTQYLLLKTELASRQERETLIPSYRKVVEKAIKSMR